jgi:hypothetical protein
VCGIRAVRRMRGWVMAGWQRLSRAAVVGWRRGGDWLTVGGDRLSEYQVAKYDRFKAWRCRFEVRLDDAAAGSLRRWLWLIGPALAVTVVAAAVLHLLLLATLVGGTWLRWTGVAVVGLIAVAVEATVVRNMFISIAVPAQRRTLLIAYLTSAAVLLVSVEAFAAVTAAITGGSGQLWPAERFYLWHLVDSVPLLAIPRRLAWSEPAPLPDLGLLVLAFKIAVIAPLVRLVVAGYELVEERGRQWRDVLLRARGGTSALPEPWSSAEVSRRVFLLPAVVVPAALYGGLGPGTVAGHRLAQLHPVVLAGVVLVAGVVGLAIGAAIIAVATKPVRALWDLLEDGEGGPLAVIAVVVLV